MFFRKDNIAVLMFITAFLLIGLYTTLFMPGDRGGWILGLSLVVLAIDAIWIYTGLNKNR